MLGNARHISLARKGTYSGLARHLCYARQGISRLLCYARQGKSLRLG
jgi:hypothetical protein